MKFHIPFHRQSITEHISPQLLEVVIKNTNCAILEEADKPLQKNRCSIICKIQHVNFATGTQLADFVKLNHIQVSNRYAVSNIDIL